VVDNQKAIGRLKDSQINMNSHRYITESHLAMLCDRIKFLDKYKCIEGGIQ